MKEPFTISVLGHHWVSSSELVFTENRESGSKAILKAGKEDSWHGLKEDIEVIWFSESEEESLISIPTNWREELYVPESFEGLGGYSPPRFFSPEAVDIHSKLKTRLRDGDQNALETMIDLAILLGEEIERMHEQETESRNQVLNEAKIRDRWPLVQSRDPLLNVTRPNNNISGYLKRICLGEGLPTKGDETSSTTRNIVTIIARELFHYTALNNPPKPRRAHWLFAKAELLSSYPKLKALPELSELLKPADKGKEQSRLIEKIEGAFKGLLRQG